MPRAAMAALMDRVAPGLNLQASGAVFDLLGRDGLTGLVVRDVALSDASGRSIATVPELGVSMRLALPGSEHGLVAIEAVRLGGARVDVRRDAAGALDFGIAGIDDDLFAGTGTAALPHIDLIDAQIAYHDAATDRTIRAHADRASIDADGVLRMAGHIDIDGEKRVPITVEAVRRDDGMIAVDMQTSRLDLAKMGALHPSLSMTDRIAMVVAGDMRVTLSPEAGISTVFAQLRAPEGGMVVVQGAERRIESLRADIRYTPDDLHITLHDVTIAEDALSLVAQAVLRRDAGGWSVSVETQGIERLTLNDGAMVSSGPAMLSARIAGDGAVIEAFEVLHPVVARPDGARVRAASLRGSGNVEAERVSLSLDAMHELAAEFGARRARIDDARGAVTITEGRVDLPGLVLAGVTLGDGDIIANIDALRADMRVDTAAQRVELDIASLDGLRGRGPEAMRVDVPGLTGRAVVDMAGGRVSVRTLRVPDMVLTLPALTHAPQTVASLDLALEAAAEGVDVSRFSARLNDVPVAGAVALSKGRFSIPDLLTDDIGAELVLGVDGPARAVLTFLDHPPLGLIAPTGLRIDAMRGRTSGKVEMILPLSSDIKLSELDFRVKADIRDFSLVEPHTQARITGNRMTATASPAGLRLRSDARINGLSARVSYEQAFTRPPPGAPEGVLTLQSYLTEEDFALRAGVDVGDYFDGVAVLDATVDMYPGGLARFSADADLTGSVLRLPLLGWRKGDGVPLTAAIRGFRRPEGTALIETIDMRGAGMMAKGRIALAPDGAVEQASFERVVLSTLLDAGLHYRRGDAQRPRQVEIAGAVLDLRCWRGRRGGDCC